MIQQEENKLASDCACDANVVEPPEYSSNIGILTEGDLLYRDMLKAIGEAEKEILLETYIFTLDAIGKRFIAELNACASRGVAVRLHLDAVGSGYFRNHLRFMERLHPDIELRWFHRWNWRSPMKFNVRNHRKLLVIDRNRVFIGGFNIHRENSRRLYGERRWRDTHIALYSCAPAAARYFDDLWYHRRLKIYKDSPSLMPNFSRRCRYLLRCRLARMIDDARKSVLVTTPYFLPDEFMMKALIRAARRGVDIRLLVPGQSDHPVITVMATHYYARLVREKISVYAYKTRMLHAKTMVVDARVVMVGSANMDYRSLFTNLELVCLFTSRGVADKLTRQFLQDCRQAERISPAARPAAGALWFFRPLTALFRHFY